MAITADEPVHHRVRPHVEIFCGRVRVPAWLLFCLTLGEARMGMNFFAGEGSLSKQKTKCRGFAHEMPILALEVDSNSAVCLEFGS